MEVKKMKERDRKIQELQIYEQNLQNILLQKQIFQAELNEIESALKELEKSKEEDCFQITGGIMVKRKKQEIEKELKEKKEITELRIKSFEKQEGLINKKAEDIRKELAEKVEKE